jgi:endogenous inhibitor of DNA gyrase (YacG/DUF329 family)
LHPRTLEPKNRPHISSIWSAPRKVQNCDMPTFACPTCQKPVEWSADAKWRPFCSERCRLIDLGAWMTEQRSIPADEADQEAEASNDHLDTDPDGLRRH